MVAKVVADAVEARLMLIGLPIVGINEVDAAPADGSPYLIVQYPLTNASGTDVGDPGNNTHRDEGGARVVINARTGSGKSEALTWSDEIIALFRGWSTLGGDLVFRTPVGGPVDDRNDNGLYFQATVAIPYQFDQRG